MPQASGTKTCNKCHEELPPSGFFRHKKTKDGLRSICKKCDLKSCRVWRVANVERTRILRRASSGRPWNKKGARIAKLRQTYGLSRADYERMLARQDGGCDICGLAETRLNTVGVVRELAVDHCHDTGQVRALLCARCNGGLGQFRDDPDLLRQAAEYVERHMAIAMMVA